MKSLYWRISLLFTIVLLVVGLVYIMITTVASRKYFLETTQKLNAQVAEYLVKETPPFENGEVNKEALGVIMHSMMGVNPSIEVYLLSPDGTILSYVVLDKKVKLKQVSMEPIKEFVNSKGEKFVMGDNPRSLGEKVIFSATPVRKDGELLGYVYISLLSEKYELAASSALGSYWLKLTLNSFMIALGVALIIGLGLIAWLTRHLRRIIKTVNQFREGDLHARVPVGKSNSELQNLARNFNHMADEILKNIEELKNVDHLRRELIANVSHDLRNPLAIISGYVETLIMKSDNIEDKERNEYLQIINHSSEKLTQLVADLFELSKLDSGQMQVHYELINIPELLQDSCLKYELFAKNKSINIKSEISPDLPKVQADLYLMDRVLQNLLDNAVKYTPAQGEIEVKACQENDRVQIEIKNSGPGIPENELALLFDRYYMIDKEKKGIEGTGLGLAIVKRIIDIHEADISVLSDSASYTAFRIHLNAK